MAASGRSPTGFSLPIHPLLIETHGRLVLADTGFGVGYRATRPDAGKLLEALRAERIAPGEIDVVLFTHLHPDHALGALDADGKPAFANAWHLVNRVEYEFWWADPSLDELPLPDERRRFIRQAAKQVLVALQGRIDQVEPEAEVAPGITIVAAPGHTPGHVAVEVASGGERLLHIGDAAADPDLHLRHPDWLLAPDFLPHQARMTRRRLLDWAATEGLLVLASHFAFPGLGRVSKDENGWRWLPVSQPSGQGRQAGWAGQQSYPR